MFEKKEFGMRIAELRINMGPSARDMSLSLGQNQGYINNIENGKNYPSMEGFFHICDYFRITPAEFFDAEAKDPPRANRLLEAVKGLNSDQLDYLIALAKDLNRK